MNMSATELCRLKRPDSLNLRPCEERPEGVTKTICTYHGNCADGFTEGQKVVASMGPKAVQTVDWEQVYRAMIDAALNTGGRDGA
jgi:hypothetical protein